MNVSSKMVDAACIAWLAHELSDEPLGVVMEAVIKAAMQVAPAVEQEPAVYLVWHDGKFTYTKYPEEIVNAYETLPLYTHPPAVEPVQTLEELEQEIYENTQTFIPRNVMQWMLKRYINHPQQKTKNESI